MKFKFILLAFIPLLLNAQNDEDYQWPSLSPYGEVTQVVGNTEIQVRYERPSVRGRKIFGELVPWDKIWRTGAGYCTRISFDRAVVINGQLVAPSTYSLFTIPREGEWTIILNRDTTLYGSGFYDEKKDVLRFDVSSRITRRKYEAITIDIDIIPNDARIFISWDNRQVSFDLNTLTDKNVITFIDQELMTRKNNNPNNYAMASDYFHFKNIESEKALFLADECLKRDPSASWVIRLKMDIFEKTGRYKEAAAEIEKAIELIESSKFESEASRKVELEFWETYKKRILAKM